MLPDRVSNPGPLTYESGALPITLRSPAIYYQVPQLANCYFVDTSEIILFYVLKCLIIIV